MEFQANFEKIKKYAKKPRILTNFGKNGKKTRLKGLEL